MSAKWMGYFFDDTDLEGAELLLALAIADHADSEGCGRPGVKLLAKKIRHGERQTQRLMKILEEKKYVEIERQQGRGKMTAFQLKKVTPTTPLAETEKVTFEEIKGDISDTEKVTSTRARIKDEPFKTVLEPSTETVVNELHYELDSFSKSKGRATKNILRSEKDSRSRHPAIQIVKGLMCRYPDKLFWDRIIARFGESFDRDLMRQCRESWVERGYNPNALTWLNWYFDGIPERNGNYRKPDKPLPTSDEMLKNQEIKFVAPIPK